MRLEHLFRQVAYHAPRPETWASRASVDSLLDITSIFSRADIKSDIIKELKRNHEKLAGIKQTPGVDVERLEQILDELENITKQVYGMNGQIGQSLRENEFLKGIMQRNSIPGGSCAFDLPLYHHWLQQPHELRNSEFQTWIDTLEPVQSAVTLLLSLTRGSTTPSTEVARNGFFQHTLDSQAPAQLVRVGLPRECGLFAEISGGKHRFTIRFLEPSNTERPSQTTQDVTFFLNCCIL